MDMVHTHKGIKVYLVKASLATFSPTFPGHLQGTSTVTAFLGVTKKKKKYVNAFTSMSECLLSDPLSTNDGTLCTRFERRVCRVQDIFEIFAC